MTDFDGTLFPKVGGELSEAFIRKIINLTDRGCLFSVNSGRPYCVLKDMLRPLANRTIFICNDGTQIMYKNCLLYKSPILTSSAEKIYTAALSMELTPFAALRERTLPVNNDILSQKNLFGEDIYKIVIIKNNSTTENISKLKQMAIANGLRICFEDNMYLEFCINTANKGTATAFIKRKFGITSGIYAFGDTEADFEMFKEADNCFLMADATHLCYSGSKTITSMQNYVIENL